MSRPTARPLLEVWSERTEDVNRALDIELAGRMEELRLREAGRDTSGAQAALRDAELVTRIAELARQEAFTALWRCMLGE